MFRKLRLLGRKTFSLCAIPQLPGCDQNIQNKAEHLWGLVPNSLHQTVRGIDGGAVAVERTTTHMEMEWSTFVWHGFVFAFGMVMLCRVFNVKILFMICVLFHCGLSFIAEHLKSPLLCACMEKT